MSRVIRLFAEAKASQGPDGSCLQEAAPNLYATLARREHQDQRRNTKRRIGFAPA